MAFPGGMHCSSTSVSLTKTFPNKALYTVFSIVGFFETDTGEKPVVGLRGLYPHFPFFLRFLFWLQKGDGANHRGDSSADITKNPWGRGWVRGVFYPVALHFIYLYPSWFKKGHD